VKINKLNVKAQRSWRGERRSGGVMAVGGALSMRNEKRHQQEENNQRKSK
jgi:hypothetical protein